MNTGPHDRLTLDLEREADQFARRGGTPLDISQVLDRAGEIRRGRRMRATMVMAACVLAIAVPTALVATDRDAHRAPTPAHDVKVDRSPLTLAGLKSGSEPGVAYLQSGTLHLDGYTYRSDTEQYAAAAPYAGGVMVAVRDNEGNLTAHTLGTGPKGSWPMSGGFATSPGGKVVAFVQPDGTPVAIQGAAAYPMPRIPRGSGFDVVAVTGEDCRNPSDSVCAVWVTSNGRSPESWVSTPEGATRVQPAQGPPDTAPPDLWRLADVFGTGAKAGTIEVSDSGSCSEVESADGTALWNTCDHRFLSFSPDGSRLLASAAYADGLGDGELAVLDADNGKVEIDLKTGEQAFIGHMVWEDDSHVLATLYEQGRWAVLRIGLDGGREYALGPVTGEDVDAPYVLPSR